MLIKSAVLKTANFSHNQFTDSISKNIEEIISMSNIKFLDISGTRFTINGIKSIGNGIKKNKKLKTLIAKGLAIDQKVKLRLIDEFKGLGVSLEL